MTNSEIIRKAEIAVTDLQNDGGYLNPEQSDFFIRTLINQPTVLRQARSVRMNSPKREINKVVFGSRILKPGVASTPLDAADRSKPTTSKVELVTEETLAEVRIPYHVIEDNIERGNINAAGPNSDPKPVLGGFKDTIVTLMAERAALDLEELALLGDTGSGDGFLALQDGYLKLITTNVVDAGGARISRSVFKAGMQAMPKPYLRNLGALAHFVNTNQEIEYRDTMAQRETTMGDEVNRTNVSTVYGFGVPVVPAATMPINSGIFTLPDNLIFGIQRQVSVESDKDISAREFILVISMRVAFQIEEQTAAVKYTNLATV